VDAGLARVDVDALSLPRRKRKPRKLEQAASRELTVASRELPDAVADTRKRRGGRPRRERLASGPAEVSGATTHRHTFADRVAASVRTSERHVAGHAKFVHRLENTVARDEDC
jgi:hypothetical protein